MLLQIGHREDHAPDDIVGPLLDCHARIRTFAAVARRIAAGEGTDAQIADAAARVERYFGVALPLHVLDEDVSLLPRLLAAPIAPELRLALEKMTEEHDAMEDLVASLLPRWAALASRPSDLAHVAPALAADTEELQRRIDAHLAWEERLFLPAVREHLGAAARAIRAEMAARRAASPG